MTKCPKELLYTKTHEWVRVDQDGLTIGITDYAQNLLGELVFVELPNLNREVKNGDEVAVLESVKTAADVYCPVAGEIIAINEKLNSAPDCVNHDPYGEGWLFKVKKIDVQALTHLINAEAYANLIHSEHKCSEC